MAVGLREGRDDLFVATHWELDVEVTPTGDRAAADAHHARWREAVARSRDWAR